MYVLDTSVIIKWFTREEGRALSIEYRERFEKGEIEIIVPDLILYEIANALRYNPRFDEKDVMDAVKSLFELGIRILIPTPSVIDRATKLAFTHDITVYDAYYVALADELSVHFVTADKKLYNKISKIPFVRLLQ